MGAAFKFWLENSASISPDAWARVGLIPYAGKEVYSVRYAPTRQAMEHLPKLRMPEKASDLNEWSKGDKLTYTSKGGVFFFAGFGYVLASANMNYLASGEFETTVKKMDQTYALVEIKRTKVNSLGVQVQGGFASVGLGETDKKWKALSFVINYKDELGRKVFEKMVHGNAVPAQRMALTGKSNLVRAYEDSKTIQKGNFKTLFFGLPIVLNKKASFGENYEISDADMGRFNNDDHAEYNVYMKDVRSRALGHHTQSVVAFYGSSYKEKSKQDQTINEGKFGQFVWDQKDDHANEGDLKGMIKSLIRRTGLGYFLAIRVPKFNQGNTFAKVDFKLTIANEQTMRLASLTNVLTADQISTKATAKLKEYIKRTYNSGDQDSVCSEVAYDASPSMDPTGMGSVGVCFGIIKNKVDAASLEMYKALKDMNLALRKGQTKAFNKAYSMFGKAMMANQFMFLAGIDLIGAGAEIKYSISGESISNYVLNYETTENSSQLKFTGYGDLEEPGSEDKNITTKRGVIIASNSGFLVPTQAD